MQNIVAVFGLENIAIFALLTGLCDNCCTCCCKERSQKKTILFGNFSQHGGGLPKSQNFCKFTKYFFVC